MGIWDRAGGLCRGGVGRLLGSAGASSSKAAWFRAWAGQRARRRLAAAAVCALAAVTVVLAEGAELPKLVELGSKSCIPCKMMAPILEELTKDYAGKLQVEFIDVWLKENVAKGKAYGIKVIPTQVFLGPDGKELWRHEGFISKEDILAKWKELGHPLTPKPAAPAAPEPKAVPATAAGKP